MGNLTIISQDLAQELFTDAFRAYVGARKWISYGDLAERTSMPERTLRSYGEGRATPGTAGLLTLISVLPSGFAERLLAPTGKGHVSELGAGEGNPLLVHDSAARMVALIAAALVDKDSPGRIDHREMAALDRAADELAEVVGQYRAFRSENKKLRSVA